MRPEARLFFEIACDASFADVRQVLRQLDMRLAGHGIDADCRGSVQLALAEAMNNIVEHAYIGRDQTGSLTLAVHETGQGLDVSLEDDGAAMPWEQINRRNSPRRPLTPQLAREGGYGWGIIRALTSELSYERDGDRNILTFHIEAPAIAQPHAGARRRDAYLFGESESDPSAADSRLSP